MALFPHKERSAISFSLKPRAGCPTASGGKEIQNPGAAWQGRKRHILVDTLGWLLAVVVSAASVQDSKGGPTLLEALKNTLPRLQKVWADEG